MIGSDESGQWQLLSVPWWSVLSTGQKNIAALQKLGVKDSENADGCNKSNSWPANRKTGSRSKTREFTPAKYNQVQPRYNAVHMKVALHNQALYLLLQKLLNRNLRGHSNRPVHSEASCIVNILQGEDNIP